jgi:hypothetical protein
MQNIHHIAAFLQGISTEHLAIALASIFCGLFLLAMILLSEAWAENVLLQETVDREESKAALHELGIAEFKAREEKRMQILLNSYERNERLHARIGEEVEQKTALLKSNLRLRGNFERLASVLRDEFGRTDIDKICREAEGVANAG